MIKAARIAILAGAAMGFVAGGVQSASAQGFFESLFGGSQPREGRSSYGQSYARPQNYGYGYGYDRQDYGYGNSGTLDPSDPRLHQEIRRRTVKQRRPGGSLAKVEGTSAGAAGKAAVVQPTAEAPRGSLAYFAKDKTLRAGDVVVTQKGFLVFQGGNEHGSNAFVAINQSGSTKGDRKNLLALEEASKMSTPNLTVETISAVRDFVGPRTSEQMDRMDAVKKLSQTAAR